MTCLVATIRSYTLGNGAKSGFSFRVPENECFGNVKLSSK